VASQTGDGSRDLGARDVTISTGAAGAVLELSDATVVKNGVRILDGLTLVIPAGEHTAILGPNGAGKTALINVLTHNDHALAREGPPPVRVFGCERWNVAQLRSRLGMVSADLHDQFVSGNCAGGIRGVDAVVSGFFATRGFLAGLPVTQEMRQQAAATLERLEAAHLACKLLNEMSTGEARRVLIARALVTEPQALVLDEPTAGLDVVARHRFLALVRKIARQGTTIVLVTHHVEEIIPEIDRVVLLNGGRIVDSGPKASMLTSERLSLLFEAPITVRQVDGCYYARADTQDSRLKTHD
jgi:iron complex transport system ATP-binding protein